MSSRHPVRFSHRPDGTWLATPIQSEAAQASATLGEAITRARAAVARHRGRATDAEIMVILAPGTDATAEA